MYRVVYGHRRRGRQRFDVLARKRRNNNISSRLRARPRKRTQRPDIRLGSDSCPECLGRCIHTLCTLPKPNALTSANLLSIRSWQQTVYRHAFRLQGLCIGIWVKLPSRPSTCCEHNGIETGGNWRSPVMGTGEWR
jgi:hypothetical protein